MQVPDTRDTRPAAINTVTIGAVRDKGGTRTSTVTVGGARCVPSAAYEGDPGHPPAIAAEIWDVPGDTLPAELVAQYGQALSDPAEWARKAVEFGAEMICLRLVGTHPDTGDRGADQTVAVVKDVLAAVGVPLIVWGCGVPEKDNVVLPRCASAAAGERCLFGTVTEKNYRTLVAACMADGHALLAESPLDINMAKQANILANDAGFPLEDIVIFPTTGALGYGFEYVYSIMERGRLAGLGGDRLLRQPVLCDVGTEAWRTKEARAADSEMPHLGPGSHRGPLWEGITATNLLQAGADIFIMRHPLAISILREAINMLAAAQAQQSSA